MVPAGFAVVDDQGEVVTTFASMPDRIRWPDGAVTQPAALMAREGWRFVQRMADIPEETRTRKLGPVACEMVDSDLVCSAVLADRTPEEIAQWDAEHKPAPVSALRFRLALDEAGILDAVEAYVSGASRAVRLSWEFHGEIEFDHPLVTAAARALSVDDAGLRALFARAHALEPGQ